MRRIIFAMLLLMVASEGLMAQKKAQQMADSIVKYQLKSGGWPKNQDWLKGVNPKEAKEWQKSGVGSTIDNGATVSEMRTLAEALNNTYRVVEDGFGWIDKKVLEEQREKYRVSFRQGLAFLLKMQYENGGFPQFYPEKRKEDYSSQITFNDNATVNVLKLLLEVATDAESFANMGIDKSTKKKCQAAYDKGIQCILDCQIRVDEEGRVLEYGTEAWKRGKKTVWCQQHDKRTLAPVKARAYELPSYSGHGETVALLELLMDMPYPSAESEDAVKCAVEWLEGHALKDVELETFTNEDGKKDIRLVEKRGAPMLWARFYGLEKAEPMYCDRDGIPQKHLSDIGYERRNGYQWIGDSPQRIIDRYRKK
ncbi:MAG: pectate lyase [Bacteroidaceae bacterium]|nr:pectate lyase [Bacteroidaceae bacterium]